jgi:hypothetical protein
MTPVQEPNLRNLSPRLGGAIAFLLLPPPARRPAVGRVRSVESRPAAARAVSGAERVKPAGGRTGPYRPATPEGWPAANQPETSSGPDRLGSDPDRLDPDRLPCPERDPQAGRSPHAPARTCGEAGPRPGRTGRHPSAGRTGPGGAVKSSCVPV